MIVKRQMGEDLHVDWSEGMTVCDLKMIVLVMIMESPSTPAVMDHLDKDNIRLVTGGGRVLRGDDMDLHVDYRLDNTSTLHMSILTSPLPSPTVPEVSTSTSTSAGSDRMGGMMTKLLMDSIDPALMQQMILSQPQVQKMIEKQPDLQHMFADPRFIRQMMEAASDPQKMLEMQKSNDLALAQIENHPGGFQALTSFYKDMDLMNGPTIGGVGQVEEQNAKNQEMARRFQVGEIPRDRPNNIPLPNPWSSPPVSSISASIRGGREMTRMQYRPQLDRLLSLGFMDEDRNLAVLIETGGDLERAVALLSSPKPF